LPDATGLATGDAGCFGDHSAVIFPSPVRRRTTTVVPERSMTRIRLPSGATSASAAGCRLTLSSRDSPVARSTTAYRLTPDISAVTRPVDVKSRLLPAWFVLLSPGCRFSGGTDGVGAGVLVGNATSPRASGANDRSESSLLSPPQAARTRVNTRLTNATLSGDTCRRSKLLPNTAYRAPRAVELRAQ
jgi:hypothetical protein